MADPYNLSKLTDPNDPSKLADDTSVLSRVTKIAGQNSKLNEMARVEGLKASNRRGLLNSSMAVGASQDAVLRSALPIASQDASQAFAGQQAGLDRALQSGMQEKQIASTEKLTLAQLASTEGLAAAQRALDVTLQNTAISAADRQQVRDISSREGMAAAERALQQLMQSRDITSTEGLAKAQRELDAMMQRNSIDATQQAQIRDIASREGLAAAERALQLTMQQRDAAQAMAMQRTDLTVRQKEAALDRGLQEKIASWNLSGSDRDSAAGMVVSMEGYYQDTVKNIMANTALSAAQRTQQLSATKALRDKQLNLVEQLYNVDLTY
jgi:hypothetical protein